MYTRLKYLLVYMKHSFRGTDVFLLDGETCEGTHSNEALINCNSEVIIMHHGTVLGDANKKPFPQNSPVMHCQHRYSQASTFV